MREYVITIENASENMARMLEERRMVFDRLRDARIVSAAIKVLDGGARVIILVRKAGAREKELRG